MAGGEPELRTRVAGRIGRITLNRPRALNALSHAMVRGIDQALRDWEHDESVAAVLIAGAGERGLCAGGDVVALYADALAGDDRRAAAFWRDEYVMNARIARYPKPYLALMDGIVLGGGIGVSAHGSHRIVTERSRLGMPEATIGFVPDVGGSWLLAHAPGELGTLLGMSAGTMGAADALELGFADAFVPSHRLPDLVARLEARVEAPDDVDRAVADFAADAGEPVLPAQRAWADEVFAGDDPRAILNRLGRREEPAARAAAAEIATKSPTSVAVILAALRRQRRAAGIEEALDQEYRVTLRAFARHDFAEGVRAQVVEKDRAPRWDPATLEQVTAADVAEFFEPLGERELGLAAPRTLMEEGRL